jgi:hypothetical protein
VSFNAEGTAIRARLMAGWTTTDIAWDDFGGETYQSVDGRPYIRPAIRAMQPPKQISFSAATGAATYRYWSLLTIQLFAPATGPTAPQDLEGYGDALTALFRRVTFSGMTFFVPQLKRIGRDRNFQQANLDTNFYRDEQA